MRCYFLWSGDRYGDGEGTRVSLPQSFIQAGFASYVPPKFKRLLIGTEGEPASGKTEFICSAPGPGIIACLDRNYEAMIDNPHPPKSRSGDFAFKVINLPLEGQAKQDTYIQHWKDFRETMYKGCAIPECRTIGIDTDNVSWDLQMLADFGRIAQVPQLLRAATNTSRRAFISKLSDSGKNIIATNMLKDEYAPELDDEGSPLMKDGKEIRRKTGERTRQGFPDQSYLWQVQLRHLVKPGTMEKVGAKTIKLASGREITTGGSMQKTSTQFGIRILKCTRNTELVGEELWNKDCNFAGLVKLIYPDLPLSAWGF